MGQSNGLGSEPQAEVRVMKPGKRYRRGGPCFSFN